MRRRAKTRPARLRPLVAAFLADRSGAVALEYGILATMIVVALTGIMTLTSVADKISNTFIEITNKLAP